MIPLHLKLKGFLSYHDPVDVDFTGFDLACISGSNGAGKSSLLDAITWALFGQARKVDDSLINTGAADKTAEVVLEFEYEGNIYRIQRSKTRDKPVRLEFSILLRAPAPDSLPEPKRDSWKPLTGNSSRETQRTIEKTLRMEYETFINASFFLQGKADLFSQQRPGDRKRILSSILGLDIWDDYRERAVELRKEADEEVASLDGQLREINTELNEGPARKARLAELEKDLESLSGARKTQAENVENLRRLVSALTEQRKLVETLEQRLGNEKNKQARMVELVSGRQKERQEYHDELERANEIEEAYRKWQTSRKELERWDGIAAQFHQEQEKRQAPLIAIESERIRLDHERQTLVDLSNSVEQAQVEAANLTLQLESARKAALLAGEKLARRDSLVLEKSHHLEAQSDARAENPRLKSEMEELKARIVELESTTSPLCPLCGQALSPEHRQALIKDLKEQGGSLGDRYRENMALLKDFAARQKEMDTELSLLSLAENDLRQQNRLADQLEARFKQIEEICVQWNGQGVLRLNEVTRRLLENDYAPEAQATLAAIDAELKAIGYDPQAHDRTRQDELNGRSSELTLRRLDIARAALAPLERELTSLEEQLAAQVEEVSHQQTAYQQASTAYTEAAQNLPDLEKAETDLFRIQEQENRIRMDVGAARQKVDVLTILRNRQSSLSAEREEKSRRIGRLKSLERAFGKDGVPALLIEQALPEIERQANQILDRLSGGTMSVRFVTQKDYKDKNRDDRKETLDIQISDGAGTRDYEMFSGGEAFRVNFAIRLALSRVLAQRAGARLQTLVVDEGFGSQDAQGRQRLIEAINLMHQDFAKILVITHMDELKDAFPYRLEVEKTPHGSTVKGF